MMRILLKILMIGIAAGIGLAACGSDSRSSVEEDKNYVNADTGAGGFTPSDFFEQCTDAVCDFNMFEGDRIEKGIGTWHPKDSGFRLVGDPVVVSVTDRYAAHPDVPVACYNITVLGSWQPDVQLSLEVFGTYGIDGLSWEEEHDTEPLVSEFEGEFLWRKRLPPGDWETMQYTVRTLKHRGTMVFTIRKEGAGEARFYLLEVDGQGTCPEDAVEVD